MRFQNDVLQKHIKSAIFALAFMMVVFLLLIVVRERFSFLMLFPICSGLVLAALYEIIGCGYAQKRELQYLTISEQELIYCNYFGKVKYKIPKQDIVQILREEDFLKVYVKTRRKLSFADKIRSIYVEDQWNMYPLMLYGEIPDEKWICGHKVVCETKQRQMQEYAGMSRYLFSFIFGCVSWYVISDIFEKQFVYVVLLFAMAIIWWVDCKWNPTNICEANWMSSTVKCIVTGLLFATYTAFASFNSGAIIFEDRGIQLLTPKRIAICFVIVLVSWGMLVFRKNLVTFVQSKRNLR